MGLLLLCSLALIESFLTTLEWNVLRMKIIPVENCQSCELKLWGKGKRCSVQKTNARKDIVMNMLLVRVVALIVSAFCL
jgi:hypothetical protein